MLTKYSKPASALLKLKKDFFTKNDTIHDNQTELSELYSKQPRRALCKTCAQPLDGEIFKKNKIEYSFCTRCGHLNGCFEDTDAFCASAYTDNDSYARRYTAADKDTYAGRLDQIYVPKAKFLMEALHAEGCDPASLRYADLGAGSGYFVAALGALGCENAVGYEVSDAQIAFARAMHPGIDMHPHRMEELPAIARTIGSEVISMIGVLEHLREPREILKQIKGNPSARYLYLSLPLHSPAVYFEAVFPTVMQRHLSAPHTHLYTNSSIEWLCREFGMKRVAEWWFGTDILDLFRSIHVVLGQSEQAGHLQEKLSESFIPMIDDLQAVIDRHKQASEVHLLLDLRPPSEA